MSLRTQSKTFRLDSGMGANRVKLGRFQSHMQKTTFQAKPQRKRVADLFKTTSLKWFCSIRKWREQLLSCFLFLRPPASTGSSIAPMLCERIIEKGEAWHSKEVGPVLWFIKNLRVVMDEPLVPNLIGQYASENIQKHLIIFTVRMTVSNLRETISTFKSIATSERVKKW